MLTNNWLINKVARRDSLPIPYAEVEGEKRVYHLTMEDLALLDNNSHNSWIGKICNKAQVLNSLLNHYNSIEYYDYIDDIICDLGTLDIMSRIAIDSAKKTFSLNNNKIFKDLNNREYYLRDVEDDKLLPLFFQKISNSGRFERKYESYNTSMDYVFETIGKFNKKRTRTKTMKMEDIINKNRIKGEKDINTIKKVEAIFDKFKKRLRYIAMQHDKADKYKREYKKRIKEEVYRDLERLDINDKTMYCLIINATSLELETLFDIPKFREKILKIVKK